MLWKSRNMMEEGSSTDTFTCTPYVLMLLLFLFEMSRSFYEDPLVSFAEKHVPSISPYFVQYGVEMVIIALILLLFDRQSEVIMEEAFLQVGNSPFHYYRSDEIEQIRFKGNFLVIKTRSLWRVGRYHVRKKQCDTAHQLISAWAQRKEIKYIRIF